MSLLLEMHGCLSQVEFCAVVTCTECRRKWTFPGKVAVLAEDGTPRRVEVAYILPGPCPHEEEPA